MVHWQSQDCIGLCANYVGVFGDTLAAGLTVQVKYAACISHVNYMLTDLLQNT